MNTPWTKLEDETIARLIGEGVPASEIARRLNDGQGGRTRSAILGRVHRLRHGSATRVKPKAAAPIKPKTPPMTPRLARLPSAPSMRSLEDATAGRNAPLPAGHDGEGLPLVALEARECRFPIGRDRRGTLFCAEAVSPDHWMPGRVHGSYCAFHVAHVRRLPDEAERAVA